MSKVLQLQYLVPVNFCIPGTFKLSNLDILKLATIFCHEFPVLSALVWLENVCVSMNTSITAPLDTVTSGHVELMKWRSVVWRGWHVNGTNCPLERASVFGQGCQLIGIYWASYPFSVDTCRSVSFVSHFSRNWFLALLELWNVWNFDGWALRAFLYLQVCLTN